MELIRDTVDQFRKTFHSDPEFVVTAPGRVNLLGEHTDYNDGFVLPIAIDRSIIVAAGERSDEEVHIHALDFRKSVITSLKEFRFDQENSWANYPLGVLAMMQSTGARMKGFNLCYRGNIPIGSGLSSSAAIEVACALALERLFHLRLLAVDLIRLAQRAEVEFVGVNCGIMDQFVSVMAKKQHALLLDCRSLQYQHIPFPPGYRIIICDTGIRHELIHSEYNHRRRECQAAVEHFAKNDPAITSLRDVSEEIFLREEKKMDATFRKRARHVVMENERVQCAAVALQRGDVAEFGKLMIDSHNSLRDLYEVSCKELDAIVEIAMEAEGVYGARMTGAGFGGCAICLVHEQNIDSLVEHLRHEYPEKVGQSLTVYIARIGEGAMIDDLHKIALPQRAAT